MRTMALDGFSLCIKVEGMTTRTEGSFEGHDGAELFYQTWTTAEARGTLVVTHGISEHSEAYDPCFATGMEPFGWNVIAWDLRGHGRSHGKRGYVDRFTTFSEDMASFIGFLRRSGKLSLPYALVSHSMGALITLRYLLDHGRQDAAALALSSPLLGVSMAVHPLKDKAARLLYRFAPSVTLFNEIRYDYLSRDPEVLAQYPKDSLRHDKISPGLYLGMFETIADVRGRASEIRLPTIIQVAGREMIVSRAEAEAFFPVIGAEEKQLIVYEDSYHEIFNDLDRERVFADLDGFLKKSMGLK